MDARSRGRKHQPWLVEANQPRHGDARVDGIANQSVAKRQRSPIDAEDGGGASRLRGALSPFSVSCGFTVAQVDEEHGSSLGGELCRGSTHHCFEIVGVGTERQYVIRSGHRCDSAIEMQIADAR
jgi:hypothetical protein